MTKTRMLMGWLAGGFVCGSAWAQPSGAIVEFEKAAFTFNEDAHTARVALRRSGSTNDAVTVLLSVEDGTAVRGKHFARTNGPVAIEAGKVQEVVAITLVDDFLAEGDKVFQMRLSDPGPNAALGAQSTATITIHDNDTTDASWLTFGLDRIEALRAIWFGIPVYQYLASLVYIFLAFFLAKLVDHMVRSRLKRWVQKTRTQFDDFLLQLMHGPTKIVVFVILLHLGLRIFAWPDWFEDFLSKAMKVVVAVSLTYMTLKLIDLATGYWSRRAQEPEDLSFNQQLLPIVRNTLKAFAVILAVLLTLQNMGLNVTSLIASLGVGGLALALAAQDTLANIFGAVVILTDKPFRIGDFIKLDSGVEGTVEEIGFRSTRVRNPDGHLVSIPNKTVGNATITNITRRPHIRTLMNIGVTYNLPPEKVERAAKLLEEICRGEPKIKDVMVTFNAFGDSALNLQLLHWWDGTDGREHTKVLQRINLAIKNEFDRAGIEFAYPTRTLYVKRDAEAVRKEG